MNKIIIVIIIFAVVAIGGYFLFSALYQPGPSELVPLVSETSNEPTPPPQPTSDSQITEPPSQKPLPPTTPPTTLPTTPPPPPASVPKTHSVSIQSFVFTQKSINIKKGDTVVWTNKDSAPHTVSGDSGGPNSGTLNNGGTYSFTFNNVGTFNYICAFHPSMTGTVVVSE